MTKSVKDIDAALSSMAKKEHNNAFYKYLKQKRIIPTRYIYLGWLFNAVSFLNMRLVVNFFIKLWSTPFGQSSGDLTDSFWSGASDIVQGDTGIKYYVWEGAGPSIFLVHGWSGTGRQYRYFIAPLVALGFRIIVFDLPGHGKNARQTTHLKEAAECLLECQALCGEPFAVVAHSLGCQTAIEAVRRGLCLQTVVFFSPGINLENLFYNHCHLLGLRTQLVRQCRARLDEESIRLSMIDEGESIWERFSVSSCAHAIKVPGLVFMDKNDEEVLLDDVQNFVEQWGDATLKFTEHNGHYHILKDQNLIADVGHYLTDFYQQQQAEGKTLPGADMVKK